MRLVSLPEHSLYCRFKVYSELASCVVPELCLLQVSTTHFIWTGTGILRRKCMLISIIFFCLLLKTLYVLRNWKFGDRNRLELGLSVNFDLSFFLCGVMYLFLWTQGKSQRKKEGSCEKTYIHRKEESKLFKIAFALYKVTFSQLTACHPERVPFSSAVHPNVPPCQGFCQPVCLEGIQSSKAVQFQRTET